jgi:hypothetical protein
MAFLGFHTLNVLFFLSPLSLSIWIDKEIGSWLRAHAKAGPTKELLSGCALNAFSLLIELFHRNAILYP